MGLGRLKFAFEVVVGNPGVVDHALDHPFGGYNRNILTLNVQFLIRNWLRYDLSCVNIVYVK